MCPLTVQGLRKWNFPDYSSRWSLLWPTINYNSKRGALSMCKYWWRKSHRLLESSWKNFSRTVKWCHCLFLGYEWHLEDKKNWLWYLSNAAAHTYRPLNCINAKCTVAKYILPSLPLRVAFFQKSKARATYRSCKKVFLCCLLDSPTFLTKFSLWPSEALPIHPAHSVCKRTKPLVILSVWPQPLGQDHWAEGYMYGCMPAFPSSLN